MAASDGGGYHPKFEEPFERELRFIEERSAAKAARRERKDAFSRENLRGLALSGGGVRSAAFAMGVVQQLQVKGVVDRLHYLSTVSGGGFTGASLTWFLSQPADGEGKRFGTERNNFPFCGGDPAGIRNSGAGPKKETEAPLDGRTIVDFIRQRSAYLKPGAGFSMISAAAIVLRSLLTSLISYVLLLTILFLPLIRIDEDRLGWPPGWLPVAVVAGLGLLIILALITIAYSVLAPWPTTQTASYRFRRAYQRFAGTLLALALACFVLGLLRYTIGWASGGFSRTDPTLPTFAALSSAAGIFGGLASHAIEKANPKLLLRLAAAWLPAVSLFLLVAGLGTLAYLLADALLASDDRRPWIAALIAFTLAYSLYANINLTGLHRFYRDRLMEAFLPDPKDVVADGQAAETGADDARLAAMCGVDADGPYHIVNTNLVLLGGKKGRYRSRQGDSFILSPLFSGSEATGYVETARWLTARPAWWPIRPVGPITLPTAMAISGAAVNPRTGADGAGMTKGSVVSALLNLLNIRLGYWVPSPRPAASGKRRPSHRFPPNFIFPGLMQGMLGRRHNEDRNWLELTDGGHFDNTGIYELVRRRVKTIILVDGTADPEISFASFANALEKIFIDFDVTLRFDVPGSTFQHLMRGTDATDDVLNRALRFAREGFAIGRIEYPDGSKGHLFYVKATLVRDVPTALYSYKAANPAFPSEPTSDQFFSEQQFEAYRTLGFVLAREMIEFVAGHPELEQALGFSPAR